jgi:hypothetical protein
MGELPGNYLKALAKFRALPQNKKGLMAAIHQASRKSRNRKAKF